MDDVILDNFEYANDASAQSAYVTSASISTLVEQTSGTGYGATVGDESDYEQHVGQSFQLASSKIITGIGFNVHSKSGTNLSGGLTVRIETNGSNKPSGTLAHANASVNVTVSSTGWQTANFATPFTLSGSTKYWITFTCGGQSTDVYIRLYESTSNPYANGGATYNFDGGGWSTESAGNDLQFRVYGAKSLQAYSEGTTKQQGSYSLKISADQTDSLNKTLTKSGLSIDLSGKSKILLQARASRTGTNFKIGIHDAGGTTSEKSITISSANTWEEVEWDISGVSDANKDNIDQIIITITNADSDNTIYLDEMYATVAGGLSQAIIF